MYKVLNRGVVPSGSSACRGSKVDRSAVVPSADGAASSGAMFEYDDVTDNVCEEPPWLGACFNPGE